MGSKLNQVIAVANGKKSQASSELTKIYHMIQKADLLSGISRTYRPKDDEGERLPAENKNIQFSVDDAVRGARVVLEEMYDVVGTQDATNCIAKADVKVNGQTVIAGVPVTHLLFLEKQLVDLATFVDKMPTLDPADKWQYDSAVGAYRTEPSETVRTKKVPKNHVRSEATKEHPAQVDVFMEDILVGYWSTTKFSGGVPADTKRAWHQKVRELQKAVTYAREEANAQEVVKFATGKPVLDYIFGTSVT